MDSVQVPGVNPVHESKLAGNEGESCSELIIKGMSEELGKGGRQVKNRWNGENLRHLIYLNGRCATRYNSCME